MTFFDSIFTFSSVAIILLGIFLLMHKNVQENLKSAMKLIGVTLIIVGITGFFILMVL